MIALVVQVISLGSASATSTKPFRLYDVPNTSYCLDVNSDAGGGSGATVDLWKCNGDGWQNWYLSGSNLVNWWSGYCLADEASGFPSDGDAVTLATCANNAHENWTLESDGDIENNSHTTYCVDASGSDIELGSCDTTDFQSGYSICVDSSGSHEYAEQYSSDATYSAEDGDLYTDSPTVTSTSDDGTASHLYMFENFENDAPEVEVGWRVGHGEQTDVSTPHYYITYYDDIYGYVETDSSSAPTEGSTYEYKLNYAGIDPGNEEPQWDYYWDTISTPKYTEDVDQMVLEAATTMAGAEAFTTNGDTVPVQSEGSSFTIKNSSGTWVNWDTSIGTEVCSDPGTSMTENTEYTNYTASGDLN